jgi:hypothetical protein
MMGQLLARRAACANPGCIDYEGGLSQVIDLRMMRRWIRFAISTMTISQVHRPIHEYDLYLTLYITSSGGM